MFFFFGCKIENIISKNTLKMAEDELSFTETDRGGQFSTVELADAIRVADTPANGVKLINLCAVWAVMWACKAIKPQLEKHRRSEPACPIWTLMVSIMEQYDHLEQYRDASQTLPEALEAKDACEQDIGKLRKTVWESFLKVDPELQTRNQLVDAPEVFQHLLMLIGVKCDPIGLWDGASIIVGTIATALAPPDLIGLTTHKIPVILIWSGNHWQCVELSEGGGVIRHDDAWSTWEINLPDGVYLMPIYVEVKPTDETWPCPGPDCAGFLNPLANHICKNCKCPKDISLKRAEERALYQAFVETNVAAFKLEQAERESLALATAMSKLLEAPPAAAAAAADAAAADDWPDEDEDDVGWNKFVVDED